MNNLFKDSWWILLFGVIVSIGMLVLRKLISDHYKKVHDECFEPDNNKRKEKSGKKEYVWKSIKNIDEEEMRKNYTTFNDHCAWYSACTQMIPLFPLMGVLGTVWGLVNQVKDGTNSKEMISSLGSALNTTKAGIICAIILKLIDNLLLICIIVKTDGIFTNYYKKLEIEKISNNKK